MTNKTNRTSDFGMFCINEILFELDWKRQEKRIKQEKKNDKRSYR